MGSGRVLFGYTMVVVVALVFMLNLNPVFPLLVGNNTVNGSSVSFDMNNNFSRSGDGAEAGMVLQPVVDLRSVTLHVADENRNIARATLYNGTDTTAPVVQVKSAAVGQDVTFSTSFIAGRSYLVTADGNGSAFTAAEDNQTVLPATSTDINVSKGFLE